MGDFQLAIHKRNTKRFIDAKPKVINLTPSNRVETAGSVEFLDNVIKRGNQTFRIIYPNIEGTTNDSDRINYRSEFILVGESTALVAIGDHWEEGPQSYAIEWVAPANGYEVKCGGTTHGSAPD